MPKPTSATAVPATDADISRRDLAVARSLDTARARAEKRVKRFLDAGFALLSDPDGGDFTVQDVVERSGQSLRCFYQHFAGKYDLLLALFEELVRFTAEQLRQEIAEEEQAVERLHRLVVEYHRLCRPGADTHSARKVPTYAMAEFGQQLLTSHPDEAAQAFEPLISLFTEGVEQAAAAGGIRSDMPSRRLAAVLLQAVAFNAFADTISGLPVEPAEQASEEYWRLLFEGFGAR